MDRRQFIKYSTIIAGTTAVTKRNILANGYGTIKAEYGEILPIASFARKYFEYLCPLPFGEHHLELFEIIESSILKNKDVRKIARAWPSSGGASTILRIVVPLWLLAYKLKSYIINVNSANYRSANCYFEDLKEIINGHAELIEKFPHLKNVVFRSNNKTVLPNDQIFERLPFDYSALRLTETNKYKDTARPDIILFDNPYDYESCITSYQKEKIKQYFYKYWLNVGMNDTVFIYIGTTVARNDLTDTLIKDKKWDAKRLSVFSGNENLLWPEKWNIQYLDKRRQEIGIGTFMAEYLNRPLF